MGGQVVAVLTRSQTENEAKCVYADNFFPGYSLVKHLENITANILEQQEKEKWPINF